MNIRIKVKQISKIKDFLTYEDYKTDALTAGELILEMVAFNVREYNDKRDKKSLFLLSDETAEAVTESEKISFVAANNNRDKKSLFLLSDETAEVVAESGKIYETAASGKISFGAVNNKRKVDLRVMQDEAIFQFKNARFKIINETKKHEYTYLDEPLSLSEGDGLVFIKLTLLSGRIF
ncbi:MAG: hypothetical protein LBT20_08580 [Clostridiales bacterium]|jgi:hypothetical protein|nr:hypothetical protein [Clostridiales bacterium]